MAASNYTSRKVSRHLILILSLLVLWTLFLAGTQAGDTDNDGLDDELEVSLSRNYAPILHFEEKEMFFPVSIAYHLNNSKLYQSLQEETLVDSSPTSSSIGNYTDPQARYYLDNEKGSLDDDGIEKDYSGKRQGLGYTVYSRVTRDHHQGEDRIVIQYWMFYAFNEGTMNTHEGDWEMVQLALTNSSEPREAMYSQHTGGQKTTWAEVEKEGTNIKVYVARGSHANYFRSYQGKLSLARDTVDDNGKVLGLGDYTLVPLGEKGQGNHSADQDWLDFAGAWGEFGSLEDELRGKRGPPGPAYREDGEMWNAPLSWGDDLQTVDSTIFRIDWFFYNFLMIFILLALLSLSVKLLTIYRRHKRTGLGRRVFSMLSIDGLNLKSIGNILTIIGMVLAVLSLFYPWYGVSVDIDSGDYRTNGMVDVVTVDGSDGVQINKLESNSGLVQLFAFPVPFSVIIALGLFFIVLSSVGLQKSSKLGKKYFWGGFKLLLPVIIILVFVAQLSSVLSLAPASVPAEVEELVEIISGSPVHGDETREIGDYGTVHITWGLEEGGLYLAVAGILLLLGGVMEILSRQDLFQPNEKTGKKRDEESQGT